MPRLIRFAYEILQCRLVPSMISQAPELKERGSVIGLLLQIWPVYEAYARRHGRKGFVQGTVAKLGDRRPMLDVE